ncbi:hypothetical protein CONCODRAFT_80854 [Conidiobolus coronatus NRRL 28638]|uniref:Carbohydrate esterase family 16 protein n=1 Tax=Conidiobolus coronatus (strain ATCC 28846 / CBS 209.66 / NRRL 28638) TaxID=796925 RepID=A0A137NR15_CONC2|nr:hypothetical protein CONCODRAFT_80854 [Conidiobolus coronatus NRRL 28638]|eukprot:KXN65162.1 hypothetical protein CONCODRAFT_80854 [Conidiobolus coronatus NRRL 28638]
MTDNGNLNKLTFGMVPGKRYYNGRYSNGPLWSDYILDLLEVKSSENWAFAGATTDNGLTYVNRFVPSINAQLNWFKLRGSSCFKDRPKNHLVSYVGGANNYLNPEITPESTIKDIRRHLIRLIEEFKFENLLVTDIPPVHSSPSYTGSFLKHGETSGSIRLDPEMKNKVEMHNIMVAELVNELRLEYPEVNIYFWNFSKVWKLAERLNPFNSTRWSHELPCFDEFRDHDGCENHEHSFFFDTFHPITQVHDYFAKDISNFLIENWKM